jgi:hypothetical protein
MPEYAPMYTGQDYMTPGAAQTVGIIADTVQFADNTMLLEVAAGKGTAAAAWTVPGLVDTSGEDRSSLT